MTNDYAVVTWATRVEYRWRAVESEAWASEVAARARVENGRARVEHGRSGV